VIRGNWDAQSGYAGALQMLRETPNFTAVLVGNDQMALGVLSAFHQHQVPIPGKNRLLVMMIPMKVRSFTRRSPPFRWILIYREKRPSGAFSIAAIARHLILLLSFRLVWSCATLPGRKRSRAKPAVYCRTAQSAGASAESLIRNGRPAPPFSPSILRVDLCIHPAYHIVML
jgi:hypothetical protein